MKSLVVVLFLIVLAGAGYAAATEYPWVISSSNGSCLVSPEAWSAEQALADGCKLTGKKGGKRGNSIIVNCADVSKWNSDGDKKRPYVWTSTREACEEFSKFLFKEDATSATVK